MVYRNSKQTTGYNSLTQTAVNNAKENALNNVAPTPSKAVSRTSTGQAAPGIIAGTLQTATTYNKASQGLTKAAVTAYYSTETLGRQSSQLTKTYQGTLLSQAQTARQMGQLAKTQGLESAAFEITQTQYPEQKKETQQNYALQRQQAIDAAAGSGTVNTTAMKRKLSTLRSNERWNLADIFRATQLAKVGQQREQVGFATKQTGLATSGQQLGLAATKQLTKIAELTTAQKFALSQIGISSEPATLGVKASSGINQGVSGIGAIEATQRLLTGGGTT